jgi:hypothetical protein
VAAAAEEAEHSGGWLVVAAGSKMNRQASWKSWSKILREAEDRMADRRRQGKLRQTVTLIWQY